MENDTSSDSGSVAVTGAIIATAVAAGVIAFLIRRARCAEEERQELAAAALEQAHEGNLRGWSAAMARELISERLVPEIKPVLLELLEYIEDCTDRIFKQAAKVVNDL